MFTALFASLSQWFGQRTRASSYLAAVSISMVLAAMMLAPLQSDAARLGGGKSLGSQSMGATKGAAPAVTQKSAVPNTAASPAAAGATPPSAPAPRSGASRFLGPLAGIAAGLGIGMLLSHLGLGGAMGEFLTLILFAALGFFVIRMLMKLLMGRNQPASAQSANALANAYPQAPQPVSAPPVWRPAEPAANPSVAPSSGATIAAVSPENTEPKWFIPADFDTPSFLLEAKKQFVAIQKIWDIGDVTQLHQFLTDDLIKALKGQFESRQGVNETEVVLLNAEMLGMEKVTDGHLASVRFSGMLREKPQTEAFRFEEIWNLFKSEQGGWMLAGIQQIPVEMAS